MENAEKALLIAAGVMIVLFLISAGTLIYNSTLGSISEATTQSQSMDIQIFNSKFELYEGNQRGTAVRKLLREAININSERGITAVAGNNIQIYSNRDEIINKVSDLKDHLKGKKDSGVRMEGNIQRIINLINTNSKYKISFEYNTNGEIYKIHID